MNNYKLGFIGAGNMAKAIISGMLNNGLYGNNHLCIFDINEHQMEYFKDKDIKCADSAVELVRCSEIIFLAVKPQNYESVLEEIKPFVTEDRVFVTIAAGISTGYVQKKLEVNCPVVRVMPNTPLLLGAGATALCKSQNVSDDKFEEVKKIFESSSEVAILSEDKMNAVVSVNGSSPAYVYLFVKAMIDWSVSNGIDYDVAMKLICKTLEGSSLMLKNSGFTPDELIKMVSSPGGTTIEALKKLDQHDFYGAIIDAMNSCAKRAEELSL